MESNLSNLISSTNLNSFFRSQSGTTEKLIDSDKVDKKLFEKLNKTSDRLLKYCQSDRMNLVNSPPYILDILPDICQVFASIYQTYENKMHVLGEIEYFRVMSTNLCNKLNKLIDLFKQAGKRIYDEASKEREQLTKHTLILSHMLAEIKSVFPKDIYEGQSFRIAKQDAAEFWKLNFRERIVVSWEEFKTKLNRVHQISNNHEACELKYTIQLTESNYVSIFEFDIFTRLFQPWNNLLNNWKFLVIEHPAYCAFSTYDEIHKRLQRMRPGSYLYRLSCTKLGQWVIGYVTHEGKILQTIPQSLVQALIDGEKQQLYLYPSGKDQHIDISSAIAATSASRIKIPKEQTEMYFDIGTTFQLCKICSENQKDRQLEPCGHLICSNCLDKLIDRNRQPTCPFCRCEIKTFVPIEFDLEEEEVKLKSKLKSEQQKETLIEPCLQCSNTDSDSTDEYICPIDETISASSNWANVAKKKTSLDTKPLNQINNLTKSNPPHASSSLKSIQNQQAYIDDAEDTYLQPHSDLLDHLANSNLNDEFNEIMHRKTSMVKKSSSISSLNKENSRSNMSSVNSMSNLQPPLIPPPPLPPAFLPTLQAPLASPPLPPPLLFNTLPDIVRLQENNANNLITIKIDDLKLVEQLALKHKCDKAKIACALIIANNDMNFANEILKLNKPLMEN